MDKDIKKLIIFLNKSGLKTISSCQGHPTDKKLFNKLYKKFKNQRKITRKKDFSLCSSGYILFSEKKHALLIKTAVKHTKIGNRLKVLGKYLLFNSYGLNKKTIKSWWEESYKNLLIYKAKNKTFSAFLTSYNYNKAQ